MERCVASRYHQSLHKGISCIAVNVQAVWKEHSKMPNTLFFEKNVNCDIFFKIFKKLLLGNPGVGLAVESLINQF